MEDNLKEIWKEDDLKKFWNGKNQIKDDLIWNVTSNFEDDLREEDKNALKLVAKLNLILG